MFGDVVEKKAVTLSFVKKELSKIKEPNYEQKLTKEYVGKFSNLTWRDTQKLIKEIEAAEIPRLKEKNIVKIIDIMPNTTDELKALIAKETITLSKDNMLKILEILAKFR
ncbi:MAG: hypothetical protein GOV00_04555 [Candidatus Altiarchaeota archaeon]|nr:hypothetical protein [Candidatus Altiarchaeota archaeon]